MAITKSAVGNFYLRLRLTLIAVLIGISAGCYGGWAYESGRLTSGEQQHAVSFVAGLLLTKLGLDQESAFQKSEPILEYMWLKKEWPVSATNIGAAAGRSFVWPWPFLGFLAGVGVVLLFSKLLERSGKK
ncbi:MAG: hypothetical protein Q7K57_44200 [Burkholderiaceae bacterium]|nr:hypothetical protein [Burkholderiaceae bacterium]